MSDQLWGSPSLAKSRIWEFAVPRGNFSTGEYFRFVSQLVLTVQETLLTSSTSRLLGKKNFRVLEAILGFGHCVSEL